MFTTVCAYFVLTNDLQLSTFVRFQLSVSIFRVVEREIVTILFELTLHCFSVVFC